MKELTIRELRVDANEAYLLKLFRLLVTEISFMNADFLRLVFELYIHK